VDVASFSLNSHLIRCLQASQNEPTSIKDRQQIQLRNKEIVVHGRTN
jgi:hypothetical protein